MTKRIGFIENFDFERFFKALKILFIDPFKEIYIGIESRRFPFLMCSFAAIHILAAHILGLDYIFLKYIGLDFLYPSKDWFWLWVAHKFLLVLSCYYLWGFYQTALKLKLTRRLTQVFTEAGLKSTMGRLPAFINDESLDEDSRKLRLKLRGQSFKDFKQVKDRLESSLQVHIDEIQEHRRSGTVSVLYSYNELTDNFPYNKLPPLSRDEYVVGIGRSKVVKENLNNVPHILLGGQTGGGKSTFLRQFITSLYLNPKNKNYSFELIDLKGGLEFQLFEKLPRVKVVSNVQRAIQVLKQHSEKTLDERMKLLKLNEVKDIESFLRLPEKERTYPKGQKEIIQLDRKIIVIDEAVEIFRAGGGVDPKDVMSAKNYAAKIAAQGRALGVHLVVATQKPNVSSVDGNIKSNLTGRVCFRMSDIASSTTILDSKRAAELSNIKGRVIWRSDSELKEIQAPNLDENEAKELLGKFYKKITKYNPDEDLKNLDSDKDNNE